MDHQPEDGAAVDAGGSSGGSGGDVIQPGAVDLMRDACFAPSDNVGDYNE